MASPTIEENVKSKKAQLKELMQDTMGTGGRKKVADKPEPLPERAPARGLEGHGFSAAESRGMHQMADGGTPKTNMGSQPKSAQEMLDRMQGAGPKRKGY